MGYAARANPTAQQLQRGEIQPIQRKSARPHFKRPDFAKQWALFLKRIGGAK